MKPLIRYILPLSVFICGAASPQRPTPGAVSPPAAPADNNPNPQPPTPPGGNRPFPPQRDRQIAPQVPPANPPAAPSSGAGSKPVVKESTRAQMPSCEEVRRQAKYGIYFDKVEIEKLVQTVADATCKTFILPENIRGKISIIGPENGRVEVDADQFYAAFLAALDSNGLTVYAYGKFLKIVEKQKAKTTNIPLITDDGQLYTTNEQMVTRLFKVKYVDLDQLRAVLQSMVSQGGDTQIFHPDTLIVNDTASNMHRLQRIVEQLDVRPSSDEIRVIQLKFSAAQEVADKITKLFESKAQRPGVRSPIGAPTPPPAPGVTTPPGTPPGMPPAAAAETGAHGGPATLSQIIPDERTNKLIIVASPAAFERINSLVKEIDIPISGEGRINVYPLENHAAEELASTLQALAQGTQNRPPGRGAPPLPTPQPAGGARPPVTAAELFSGEVKISADKSTNSLVIIASQSDYRSLVRVIEKLDIPRRQVFVEAVIMEVNLERDSEFGVDLHGVPTLKTSSGNFPIFLGTKYTKQGLPPSVSIANLLNFGGFLAGIQGANVPELQRLGVSIPQFGVILHALQSSSDTNVLSTPHLLMSDNEEAEITVGQNVPFQAGFSPSNLNLGAATGLPGTTPTTTPTTGTTGFPGGVNPLFGGLGSLFAPITRQNVELKLTIKPQINESDFIRMVISEQTEEIASSDPVLGPTTSKRTAKTTVVAKDQETVVLGGIMQDRTVESVSKVPVLGDIPILGHLFREQTHKKFKTNLLLFLTPYIIKDPADFRRIFERKMQERQQFIEQFYGQLPGYEATIDFARKAGPLAKLGRVLAREQSKVEFGGPGLPGERVLRPRGEAPEGPQVPGPIVPPSSVPPALPPETPPPPETTPQSGQPEVKPPPQQGSQGEIQRQQSPANPTPPKPDESLRVQPETKEAPRE